MKAIYAGSFDPITFGHEAIINAAAKMYDLTVVIAFNAAKKHVFSLEERQSLVRASLPTSVDVDVLPQNRLLATYCKDNNIDVIVRGLRNGFDLEYEMQLAAVNADQCSSQTVFLPAPARLGHVSSSMVKEVASMDGDISKYVNLHVNFALTKKFTS